MLSKSEHPKFSLASSIISNNSYSYSQISFQIAQAARISKNPNGQK
jgi:hypothetical protein